MVLRQSRSRKLKLLAVELGLSYDEEGRQLLPIEAHRFYLGHPSPTYFHNFLYGWHKDAQILIFDLGAATTRHANRYPRHTVVRLVSYDLCVPHFAIIPIHSFVNSHPVFGEATINFRQTDVQFANRYVVQGHDEWQIQKLLNEPLRTRLNQLANRHCEGKGDQFLFYYQGHCIQPDALPGFIAQAYEVFELFATKTKDPIPPQKHQEK